MEDNSGDVEKIIIRRQSESSISKAVFSWDVATARVAVGKTTSPIFLKNNKYYLQCTLNLRGGDIIRIGNELETKYRIVDDGTYERDGSRNYRIRRLDKNSMTNLDIDNSKIGTVIYLNTPSDKEILCLMNKI